MRRIIIGLCMAFGLALAGPTAASAAPAANGLTVGDTVTTVQYAGFCEKLRRDCVYKEARGETGRGNCHRYRVECGHAKHCENLRKACRYKHERGEVGEGNCRRYKYECNP
jgi:hypothetical protein